MTLAIVALAATGCAELPSPAPISAASPTDAASQDTPPIAARTPDTTGATSPAVTIGQLMGADEAALHRLLGPPQFRRRDPPAQLLRYRAPICLLDLFLYPEKGGNHRVSHVEARGRDGKDRPAAKCLELIANARKKAETG